MGQAWAVVTSGRGEMARETGETCETCLLGAASVRLGGHEAVELRTAVTAAAQHEAAVESERLHGVGVGGTGDG